MKVQSSAQGASLEHVAHLRHELLTPINHILGFTEIQIEEAAETGLHDYVPALKEINTRGRTLLAIIEDELAPLSTLSDLKYLDAHLESDAGSTLCQVRKLAEQLHAIGHHSAAEELHLVSSALEQLLSISHQMVQDLGAGESTEQLRK
jgi:signal transduction histidine kinase